MSVQLPAYLQAHKREQSLTRQLLGNLGSGQPPRVSIKGNRFTLIDAAGGETPVQTLFLDVIIVDANKHVSKSYREGGWDPDNPTGPVCFSDNGVGPSTLSEKPQNPVCVSCPNNVRGSAVSNMSGKPMKACRDEQNLAVMIADDPRNALYQLKVTPGSLGAFRKYMIAIDGYGVDTWMLHTRLSFDSQGVGILKFEPSEKGFVPEHLMPTLLHIREAGTAQDIVGGRDQARPAALPAPTEKWGDSVKVTNAPQKLDPQAYGQHQTDPMEPTDHLSQSREEASPKRRGRPAGSKNRESEPKGDILDDAAQRPNLGNYARPPSAERAPEQLPPFPFQQRNDPAAATAQPAGNAHQQGVAKSNVAQFGIVQDAKEPDSKFKDMLDNVFGLPV